MDTSTPKYTADRANTKTLHLTRDPEAPYVRPYNCGLWSANKAVACDLGKLLSLLGQFGHDRLQGPAADQIQEFRLYLHYALKDDGYRITGKENGWKVLTPKREPVK